MTRAGDLQDFIDATLAALEAHLTAAESRPSVARIRAALEDVSDRGADTPREQPVCALLPGMLARRPAEPALAALFDAIAALAPRLVWRTRPGNGSENANFEDGHANAMVVGPGGVEHRHDVWIGLSLLAPEVRYPDHDHAPEETYLVLSEGEFRKDGGDWFAPGVGGSFYVRPNAVHAMRSGGTPLLALWALAA